MRTEESEILRAKNELISAALRARHAGIQKGNGGNLSSRVRGTELIVIKPRGASFEECTIKNIVTVTVRGEVVDGDWEPSSELQTHLEIYRIRPQIGGIFHSHSPWAIAAARLFRESLPLVTIHSRLRLREVPIWRPEHERDQDVPSRGVGRFLQSHPLASVVIELDHGIFSTADTLRSAELQAELVEETAQIAWLITIGSRTLAETA